MTSAESVGPRGSLRVRMLLSATLVLAIFLGVVGLVLDNAFRQSAQQGVWDRLQPHIYGLISVTQELRDEDEFSLDLPKELLEPQFNNLGTGHFSVLFDEHGNEIWRSISAIDLILGASATAQLMATSEPGVMTFGQLEPIKRHGPLFFVTYMVIWQTDMGQKRFVYAVLEDFVPYRNEVASFRGSLWGWLLAGVFLLVGVQAAIMYWGLLPITGLERDLKAIEGGERAYLEGQYPTEISGVTRSLNILLEAEREHRERYRTTLADLAHSLKTPLAILKAEAQKPSTKMKEIDEQVDRMNEIVSYQLERAVSRSSTLVKQRVPVAPVAEKLKAALLRVYSDKHIDMSITAAGAVFPGDERDLMEVLGNLLDNACKYGDGKVRLRANQNDESLKVVVEDNGPGIDVDDRHRVLQRGMRLDSRESGQGIGLAVVTEIVSRFSGQIEIDISEFGGAKITLLFS